MEQTCNGNKGDLIEIFCWTCQHWAVYIGGQEVVHFTNGQSSGSSSGSSSSSSSSSSGSSGSSGRGSSTGKVLREKFSDVVGKDRYQVNNLLDDSHTARDPSIIVKEALAMVGRLLKYDLVDYNCEHFATEMRYGKAESRQVKKTVITTVAVAGGAVVASVALVAVGPVVAAGVAGATVVGGAVSVFDGVFRGHSRS